MPIEFKKGIKFVKRSIEPHECITVVGKKGTGKSVLFDTMMDSLKNKTLIILIDTKVEYKHIPELSLDHLYWEYDEKTKKKKYAFPKGLFRVYGYDDMYGLTETMSEMLFERENCILAIEELGNCTKKHTRFYDCNPKLAKVIQQGRGKRVGFLGTTQRLQEIHTTILSESDHIICFRLTSEADEKYMRNYIKPQYIQELGKHEFLHLNLKGDYLHHCWRLHLTPERLKYYTKVFGRA